MIVVKYLPVVYLIQAVPKSGHGHRTQALEGKHFRNSTIEKIRDSKYVRLHKVNISRYIANLGSSTDLISDKFFSFLRVASSEETRSNTKKKVWKSARRNTEDKMGQWF